MPIGSGSRARCEGGEGACTDGNSFERVARAIRFLLPRARPSARWSQGMSHGGGGSLGCLSWGHLGAARMSSSAAVTNTSTTTARV